MQTLRKSLQSFVVFPVLAANLVLTPFAGVGAGTPSVAAISPDINRPLVSETTGNKQADLAAKAQKIDAYFAKYDLPLAGKGAKLASAAEENDLPWPLIAAMAMQESTGGKFACGYNAFGWGSCKGVKFTSYEQAIDTVARAIGGNDPKTARYYDGKPLPERLKVYNGRAVADYAESVQWIMTQIENQQTTSSDA
jgi:hypothetical protein